MACARASPRRPRTARAAPPPRRRRPGGRRTPGPRRPGRPSRRRTALRAGSRRAARPARRGLDQTDPGSVREVDRTSLPANYKWIVLSNTTIGMLLATINSSILLIALPDIFRGIHIDPLAPGNTNFLLWMILGFLVVTAVLVVSLGRLGDIYGRVRMYNLGFAVFTVFSILLFATPFTGSAGALWLIGMR